MNHYQELGRLINPVPWDDFYQNTFGKRALHIKGSPERFDNLLTRASLNTLLNAVPHPHPDVKTYQSGRPIKFQSPIDIKNAIAAGATFIFENIDRYHPPLGELLNSITAESWIPARFNMYMSQPGVPGYNIHYDTHDFLALQIEGKKEWVIYPPTISHPIFFNSVHDTTPPPPETELLRCILEPGDVLYVPRGFWHGATASGSVSIHLTLALFIRTGVEFLQWILDDLRSSEVVRNSLPLLFPKSGINDGSTNLAWINHVKDIRQVVDQALSDPKAVSRFIQYYIGKQTWRQPYAFTSPTASNRAVLFKRKKVPLALDVDTSKLSIFGSNIDVSPQYSSLLLRIIVANETVSSELAAEFNTSHRNVLGLMYKLAEHGAGDISELE